ncbi:MAG: hypothetical protein VCD34_10270 [Planctomycetota bacterium]
METYRRDRSYRWNYERGPSFSGSFPAIPDTPLKDFFGSRVSSRLGVAAGILLNSKWIECYSRLGFDVLTYKTVRSRERPCYPLPNWVFVESKKDLEPGSDEILRIARRRPRDPAEVTSAVCFGMPSQPPEVWRRDVSRAHSRIRRGQVLVVSVVGTPEDGGGEESLVDDFCRCARWASEAGADIVEANFSCPNVCTAEGSVYQDPGASGRLAAALRDVLPSTPLLIKSGHFRDRRRLGNFYRAVSGSADGVVLVNGVSRRVLGADNKPVFGDFERVGILGRAIHPAAVSNVTAAVRFCAKNKLGLGTIAVGGVTGVEDPAPFFDAGARGVVMGGVPMLDPHLALRMKKSHPGW